MRNCFRQSGVLADHKVAITKQSKDCEAYSKAINKGETTRFSQKAHTILRETLSWSLLSHNAILLS